MDSPCTQCHGLGEIVVASWYIGDGCYDDDFATCPQCGGSGEASKTA